MPNTFHRRCESALTPTTFLTSAWRCGSVAPGAFRVGLAMLAAALLLILTGCSTVHGITRVGTTEREVVAGALSVSEGQHEGNPEDYSYFASTDGGLTWNSWVGQLESLEWSGDSVDTPRGVYQIDGSNIVLHFPDGTTETVYPAERLRTSSNRWFQAKETQHLGDRKLALGPRAIVYDHHSGNVIVAMGILGVAVGTPDGRWTPTAIDTFSPISISNSEKISALLSDYYYWGTVLAVPWSLIAIAFVVAGVFVKRGAARRTFVPFLILPVLILSIYVFSIYALIYLVFGVWIAAFTFLPSMVPGFYTIRYILNNIFIRQADGDEVQAPGCLVFMTLPCLFLSIVISASFLATLGGYDESPSNLSGTGIFFVPLSVAAALFTAAIAWRGQWRVSWRAVAISLVAMMAFIALPYLAWAQSEVPRGFAALAAVVLCIVTTSLLVFFLVRQSPWEQDGLPTGR